MADRPPQIDNAPGLAWRPIKGGWQARWRRRPDIEFQPKTVRLWASTPEEPEPSPATVLYIQGVCQRLQSEMLSCSRGVELKTDGFNGTIRDLIYSYQTDADSPYKKARYASRIYYDSLCRRIAHDHGDVRIEDIKARTVLRWHEEWTTDKDGRANAHIPLAHALAGMLRTLIGFGTDFLEDEECERLAAVMHRRKFKQGSARNERLTAAQATAIRARAHARGRKSIALAQAFQFDLMLRQKDVIGEWVPLSEPVLSTVTHGNKKWLRGLRWEEINSNFVLKHMTSKRDKEIEVQLVLAPMVMEELALIYGIDPAAPDRALLPASGPIIMHDNLHKPWLADIFRKTWRMLADQCDIPKSVRNMDSRAGAITEATEAGAELESIKHAATHGDISMTQRYARGGVEKTAEVMQLRAAHRKTQQERE